MCSTAGDLFNNHPNMSSHIATVGGARKHVRTCAELPLAAPWSAARGIIAAGFAPPVGGAGATATCVISGEAPPAS